MTEDFEFDAFISHAAEDKTTIVRKLASSLTSLGIEIWYDEFSLKLGDSLSESIDKGLAKSRYGVVILSEHFFSKNWPKRELSGLVAKEIAGEGRIIPIWFGVAKSDVLKFSPPLADRLALIVSDDSIDEITLKIAEVVRPDIFENILKKAAFLEAIREGEIKDMSVSDIKFGPIRHETLSDNLIRQIRLIRAALLVVYPHSMEYWMDGFRRDTHPEREIAWWTHTAGVFLEYMFLKGGDLEALKKAFSFLAQFRPGKEIDPNKFPGIDVEFLKNSASLTIPPYDLENDPFPASDEFKTRP